MLSPVNEEWVFRFYGKNIDSQNDLPTEGIGTGSEAIDLSDGTKYIFTADDSTWNEVTW